MEQNTSTNNYTVKCLGGMIVDSKMTYDRAKEVAKKVAFEEGVSYVYENHTLIAICHSDFLERITCEEV